MAASEAQRLFECSSCPNKLDIESKTLPCLHSLCKKCFHKQFQGETSENAHCPECQEIFINNQLTLSQVLVNSLKSRKMESPEWKCDLCLDDGKAFATSWCDECIKFFCEGCSKTHNKIIKTHDFVEFGKDKEGFLKSFTDGSCYIHNKMKNFRCSRCIVSYCKTCYKHHLKKSPECPYQISVSQNELEELKSKGDDLFKEIPDLEKYLKKRNEIGQKYCIELENECDSKCEDIWLNYEDILDKLQQKMHKTCEELRALKEEQVRKWKKIVKENEKMLKKLEIWRINLSYLLKKDQSRLSNIIPVENLEAKLDSLSDQVELVRNYKFEVKFSDYWLKIVQEPNSQSIASTCLDYPRNSISLEDVWSLPEDKHHIISIVVSEDNRNIYLCDGWNKNIIELNECGIVKTKSNLFDGVDRLQPYDMCFFSYDCLLVLCWLGSQTKFVILKINPQLKITNIIDINVSPMTVSFCQIEEKILTCSTKFKINYFTRSGDSIRSNKIKLPDDGAWPLIRANPSNGTFWGTRQNSSKIFSFNEYGRTLSSLNTTKQISDFSVNKFDEVYICNKTGIFSLDDKFLFKFDKEPEEVPNIFVTLDKIFVCLKIDKKYEIQIFKFVD